ncbi:MAG TPA: hypothetical protein PK494_00700, partial [Tenuifilaceae bacterium]|nr:hypothetical protein [Tenuifilaceae bacterium]
MNCFYHPETTIVATCQDCGKGLCSNCASNYTIPMCKQCYSLRKKNDFKIIRKEFAQVILIGALITFFIHGYSYKFIFDTNADLMSNPKFLGLYVLVIIVNFYYSMGIVVGWKTLNRLTPQIFLVLPLIGWLIYFIVKLYVSMFVGLAWTPVFQPPKSSDISIDKNLYF